MTRIFITGLDYWNVDQEFQEVLKLIETANRGSKFVYLTVEGTGRLVNVASIGHIMETYKQPEVQQDEKYVPRTDEEVLAMSRGFAGATAAHIGGDNA